MGYQISRQIAIGEKQVLVVDGLFPSVDIESLYAFLARLPYGLDDIDSRETAYSRHWKAELPIEMATASPILRQCIELTEEIIGNNALRLRRVHSNLHLYGDVQFPHVDSSSGVTTLYYANPGWDEKWMGETIFYDDNREPIYAVAPKAGRVVMFDGDILHRAGVPSRECFQPRISFAFKFTRA